MKTYTVSGYPPKSNYKCATLARGYSDRREAERAMTAAAALGWEGLLLETEEDEEEETD